MEIKITKKANGPIPGALHVSLGGGEVFGGYYCIYRGTKEETIECLRHALKAMEGMATILGPDKEPDIQPDGGKRFA